MFWIGFGTGFMSLIVLALLAATFKGNVLMVKSQQYYFDAMRRRKKSSDKLIDKQSKKK